MYVKYMLYSSSSQIPLYLRRKQQQRQKNKPLVLRLHQVRLRKITNRSPVGLLRYVYSIYSELS